MKNKNKQYCDCGKPAKWLYMPYTDNDGNPFYCEDCVSRGCSCNHNHTVEDFASAPTKEDGVENVDWKWIELDKVWVSLDKGRQWPCCEFDWDEDEDNFESLMKN